MPITFSTAAACYRWRPGAWLRVTGPDAAVFLQGQFSNDLRQLGPAGEVYGLWLSLKGRVVADSFILRGAVAGEWWIGSYFSAATVIRERLESHLIADDVVIEDFTGEWSGITILNTEAAAWSWGWAAGADRFIFSGRRGGGGVVECVYRDGAGEPPGAAAGGVQVGDAAMKRRRLASRIPAVPADVGPGDLPNEAGLEQVAVSYTKGCYLGQEVMARLKSMGQVRRRLVGVKSASGVLPATPAALFLGARQVGDLRSVVADESGGWMGLAMVSLWQVPAGATLALAADADAAAVVLLES